MYIMRKVSVLGLALCCSFVFQAPTQAKDLPIKLKGTGLFEQGIPIQPGSPTPLLFTGVGTLLGNHFGEGAIQVVSFTSPTTGEFSSSVPLEFTAASGDQLVGYWGRTDHGAAQPGQLTLLDAGGGSFQVVFVGEFVPDPTLCTGRFAGATGSIIIVFNTASFTSFDVPVSYSWEAAGSIAR